VHLAFIAGTAREIPHSAGENAEFRDDLDRLCEYPRMKREYPESPLIGIGAVIIDSGRVVLVKRGHAPFTGEWSIPGGALELGECVRDAVIREAREETTLAVEPLALLGVYDRVIRDNDERILYHYVLVDYLCKWVSGELLAASDCDLARWFTIEEVAAIPLPQDTAEVVRLGFERAAQPGS
jgi:8-oxo-dGTP diphosphatase